MQFRATAATLLAALAVASAQQTITVQMENMNADCVDAPVKTITDPVTGAFVMTGGNKGGYKGAVPCAEADVCQTITAPVFPYICYFNVGDVYTYTVTPAVTGTYALSMSIASAKTVAYDVDATIGGLKVFGEFRMAATGGWEKFINTKADGAGYLMNAGQAYTIAFSPSMTNGGVNIDSFTLTRLADPTTTVAAPTTSEEVTVGTELPSDLPSDVPSDVTEVPSDVPSDVTSETEATEPATEATTAAAETTKAPVAEEVKTPSSASAFSLIGAIVGSLAVAAYFL